jgi:hypothetical protein
LITVSWPFRIVLFNQICASLAKGTAPKPSKGELFETKKFKFLIRNAKSERKNKWGR